MLAGAFAALVAAYFSGSTALGAGAAVGAGAALGLGFAWVVVRRNANQVVAGTALNLLAVGLTGVAYTTLAPRGTVFVHGEYWDAVARAHVAAGDRVKVVAVDGLKIVVDPL